MTSFNGDVYVSDSSSIETLGLILLSRFVLPFEIVSFVLLAALIGGIVLARKDDSLISDDSI